MKSTLKDGAGKNLLVESTIFTGIKKTPNIPFISARKYQSKWDLPYKKSKFVKVAFHFYS